MAGHRHEINQQLAQEVYLGEIAVIDTYLLLLYRQREATQRIVVS